VAAVGPAGSDAPADAPERPRRRAIKER
jgi:hypothetical protein